MCIANLNLYLHVKSASRNSCETWGLKLVLLYFIATSCEKYTCMKWVWATSSLNISDLLCFTNMLKKIWSVGNVFVFCFFFLIFYFSIFSPEKNRIGPVIV